MSKELAKVESNGLWRGHLQVKSNTATPTESEYDMFRLHNTGLSIPDIAEANDITEGTVRKAIKKVEKFFESKVSIDVAGLKMRQHARLEAMVETALEDYQSSGGKVVTRNQKRIPGENGMDPIVVEETVTEKEMTRDPKFLKTAMDAMESQRRLWPGAVAPSASTLTNVQGDDSLTISVQHVARLAENLTDEEIAALEKLDQMMDEDAIDV